MGLFFERIIMKLYVWQPDYHGPLSFFVMAESEEKAEAEVNKYIHNHRKKTINTDKIEQAITPYDYDGLGSEGYSVKIYNENEVVINDNS